MTRTLRVVIVLSVVVFLAFAFVGSTGASVEPQLMRVTLKDYQLSTSQFVVAPGKAVNLVIDNEGDMPHQVVIQSYADPSKIVMTSPVIGSHTIQNLPLRLDPGVYRISCDLWDHAQRGMLSVIAAETPRPVSFPIQIEFVVPIIGLVLGSAYILADSIGLRLKKA